MKTRNNTRVQSRWWLAARQAQVTFAFLLAAAPVAMSVFGIVGDATAQMSSEAGIVYTDDRVVPLYQATIDYIDGSFGALLMAGAGFGAIVSAALAKFRADKRLNLVALALFLFSVGVFFARAAIGYYFNDPGIQE